MAEIANLVVRYSADTANAEAGASRVESGISKFGKTAALVTAAAGVAVGGFFAKSIGAAANFEQSMDGVAASLGGVGTATGITEAQFVSLQEEALRIGETTSVGATDAARAMDLLAKAGIPVEEIYNGAAQAVVNVSEATGESLNQSASTFGSMQNLFRDTGISASEMSDVIVNAMNSSDATMSEMQTGIANLAPVVAGTGMDFGEAAGLISYFNSQGMAAAKVGSSLTSMYMNLVNPTTTMAQAQKDLGIAVYDANNQFVGLPAVLDQVRTATEGMDEASRDAWLTQLFGAEALDVVQLALKDNEGALDDHIDAMNKSGTAATASATRMDNLRGDIEGLKGAFETLSIRVGTAFLPALRGVVQGLTDGVQAVTAFAQSVIDLMDNGLNPVAAVFMAVSQAIASIGGDNTPGPLAALARGFRDLAVLAMGLGEALGDVIDAFQDLVAGDFAGAWREIQEAVATATIAVGEFAANVWSGLVNAFEAINWGAVWDTVVSSVQAAVRTGIDIGTVAINGVLELGRGLLEAAGDLWGWVKSKLGVGALVGDGTGGPESGYQVSLGTVLIDGLANLGAMLQAIANDVGGWLTKQLNAGLNKLIQLSGVRVDARDPDTSPMERTIGDKIKAIDWYRVSGNEFSYNFGQSIGKRIADGINQISLDNLLDLSRMGSSIQQKLITALGAAFAGGGLLANNMNSMMTGLFTGVVSNINWGQIGNTLQSRWRDALTLMVTNFGGVNATIARGISDLLQSSVGSINWGSIGSAIQQRLSQTIQQASQIASNAFQTFSDAASRILGRAASAISSALAPVSTAFDTLSTAAGNAVTLVKNFITEGIDKLANVGSTAAGYLEPITSALEGIGEAIDALIAKWNTLPFVGGESGLPPHMDPRRYEPTPSGGSTTNNGTPITTLPAVGSGSTAGAAGVLAQVRAIGQQITAAMNQIANAVRSGVQQAQAALMPFGNAFRTMGTQVQAATTQMAAMVRTQFTTLQAALTASTTAMTTQVRTQFTMMSAAVNASVTQMTALVRAQFTALQASTTATMTAMTAQVRAQFTALQASATASANQMRATVQSAMQAMASAGAAAMNQFAGAVRSGFQQAVAAAQSGVAAIRGAVNSIGSLYGQGFSIGSSFGQGVAAGLYSMLGAVQAAAAAIVAAAASAAAAAARISSPSRLMRDEIGVPLGQGVAAGIESQRRNVADTFASLIPGGANLGRGMRVSGASAYASGRGSAPVQNVTIITLEPGKWQEYLRKADNGNRAYQQQQPRSREIALGGMGR